MPEVDGQVLAAHLAARWPGLPVVFISGALPAAESRPGNGDWFLEKPFTPAALLSTLADVLGTAC